MKKIYILIMLSVLSCGLLPAQDEASVRSFIRSGNSHYRDSVFAEAEMDYRRALAINETDTVALFNLANALIMQQDPAKVTEADSLLQIVITKAEQEGNRHLASECLYQHGEIAMFAEQYDKAADAFKESLKRNPTDDDARFNYLLAKKLLKQQQNQNQNQDQNQQQQQQQQQEQQNQEQQQQQQQQNQNQNQPQQQQQQQEEQQQRMSQDQLQSILEQNEREEKETQSKVMRRQKEKDDKTKKEMEMRRRNGTLKDW